jgi:tRNA(Leu) C34 or U34 (ribose-2'-O)-methylase TrmL
VGKKNSKKGKAAEEVEFAIFGKNTPPKGLTPAIGLVDPKYAANVAKVIRTASCFGAKQVWFSGERVQLDIQARGRLPREERMKGYKDVEVRQYDYFLDQFPRGTTPVAVELVDGAEKLTKFVHPENPVYVFGPEDGSIPKTFLRLCHRRVVIPSRHCFNLAMAVSIVLYDWMAKTGVDLELDEHRGIMAGPEDLLVPDSSLKELVQE